MFNKIASLFSSDTSKLPVPTSDTGIESVTIAEPVSASKMKEKIKETFNFDFDITDKPPQKDPDGKLYYYYACLSEPMRHNKFKTKSQFHAMDENISARNEKLNKLTGGWTKINLNCFTKDKGKIWESSWNMGLVWTRIDKRTAEKIFGEHRVAAAKLAATPE